MSPEPIHVVTLPNNKAAPLLVASNVENKANDSLFNLLDQVKSNGSELPATKPAQKENPKSTDLFALLKQAPATNNAQKIGSGSDSNISSLGSFKGDDAEDAPDPSPEPVIDTKSSITSAQDNSLPLQDDWAFIKASPTDSVPVVGKGLMDLDDSELHKEALPTSIPAMGKGLMDMDDSELPLHTEALPTSVSATGKGLMDMDDTDLHNETLPTTDKPQSIDGEKASLEAVKEPNPQDPPKKVVKRVVKIGKKSVPSTVNTPTTPPQARPTTNTRITPVPVEQWFKEWDNNNDVVLKKVEGLIKAQNMAYKKSVQAALQKLAEQNQLLETRVNQLEAENKKLHTKVSSLETKLSKATGKPVDKDKGIGDKIMSFIKM